MKKILFVCCVLFASLSAQASYPREQHSQDSSTVQMEGTRLVESVRPEVTELAKTSTELSLSNDAQALPSVSDRLHQERHFERVEALN
jgi:hypothetical protein